MNPTAPDPVGEAPGPPADAVLLRRLRRAAGLDGYLPFDRYMEIVLYDPGHGFYDRGSTRLGRAGDFYTAAHVHRLFGATLARHLAELRRRAHPRGVWAVVEVGPGDGTLAADILEALDHLEGDDRSWEYVLVERSPALQAQARERLEATRSRIPWRFVPSLASLGPVRGVVLANELLDAFPVRRLRRTPEGWAEMGVHVAAEGPLTWAVRGLPPESAPPSLPLDASEGTVLEVSPTAEAWIREVADHLAEGRALLIDYGDDEDALVARVPSGTLEALRSHRSVDPLSHPGTADLSSWVNFTRVRRAAASAGLSEVSYTALRDALLAWGLDQVRGEESASAEAVDAVKLQLAQKSFLLSFETFRVLELSAEPSHAGGGENRS